MEDEELNEEVMGDPDNVKEVDGDLKHDEADAGEFDANSEEPATAAHEIEDDIRIAKMEMEIEDLTDKIAKLTDSISTIIEAGGTITEPAASTVNSEDEEEPYLYLEDLDYSR